MGDKYFEYIKSCEESDYEEGQIKVKRVPEAMPDGQTNVYKYLDARDTPLEVNGKLIKC